MIADTAVTTKPNTSIQVNISLCLKLPTGGLIVTFFVPCRAGRVRGLRSGLASGLTFFGLLGVIGLFIGKSIKTYKHYQFYLSGTVLFN
jgi:hypothetical protein